MDARLNKPRMNNESPLPVTADELRSPGQVRLAVLQSLPRRHQEHFFEEVRKLCAKFISSQRIGSAADRESESLELFSEVMAKLIGAAKVGNDEKVGNLPEIGHDPAAWSCNDDPQLDERVVWLIGEVGGTNALRHRHEDIRRRRYGRWRDGYRDMQLGDEHIEEMVADPVEPHHDRDVKRAWLGLLDLAEREFTPDGDVTVMLQLLASRSDIQDGFASEWPVKQIVEALNATGPDKLWHDDRVENAKRRIRNWLSRIKKAQNLGEIELMALLARYGRLREEAGQTHEMAFSTSSGDE
jgi:hypothetical protein